MRLAEILLCESCLHCWLTHCLCLAMLPRYFLLYFPDVTTTLTTLAISPCEMNEFSSECEEWETENGPYVKGKYMINSNDRTKGR